MKIGDLVMKAFASTLYTANESLLLKKNTPFVRCDKKLVVRKADGSECGSSRQSATKGQFRFGWWTKIDGSCMSVLNWCRKQKFGAKSEELRNQVERHLYRYLKNMWCLSVLAVHTALGPPRIQRSTEVSVY